ncbi:nucleolin-like [Solenopsis invicta]|uniref:nucleolin-like n=1 Tax=Solenopsis invicta TaxID=13686 RepID=UPI00193CF151|nr:nucleolin-like [Solenopsis invicta]
METLAQIDTIKQKIRTASTAATTALHKLIFEKEGDRRNRQRLEYNGTKEEVITRILDGLMNIKTLAPHNDVEDDIDEDDEDDEENDEQNDEENVEEEDEETHEERRSVQGGNQHLVDFKEKLKVYEDIRKKSGERGKIREKDDTSKKTEGAKNLRPQRRQRRTRIPMNDATTVEKGTQI